MEHKPVDVMLFGGKHNGLVVKMLNDAKFIDVPCCLMLAHSCDCRNVDFEMERYRIVRIPFGFAFGYIDA